MATISTIAGADVRGTTGFNTYITSEETDGSLDAWLEGSIIPKAELRVRLKAGEAAYAGSDWTEAQASAMEAAVCYYAAAMALLSPELQKATGSHSPLLMEDAEEIAALRDRLVGEAEEWIALATSGHDTAPFSLPSIGASTFTPTQGDRTPLQKLDLLDERDNISANDTARG